MQKPRHYDPPIPISFKRAIPFYGRKYTSVYYRTLQIYPTCSMKAESSKNKMKVAFLQLPRACNRNARWRNSRLPHRKGHVIMRSITLKAALAALIVTVPLSGAFAANGNGGTGGNSNGSNGESRGSDGIGSFYQLPEPLGAPALITRRQRFVIARAAAIQRRMRRPRICFRAVSSGDFGSNGPGSQAPIAARERIGHFTVSVILLMF